MESYKILTNWRVIFISVFSLLLSFSVNAEISDFEDGLCAAPTKFVKSSFNSSSKDVFIQWTPAPGAVDYRIKATFDNGSSSYYTTNGNTSKTITAPAAAKSLIITVETECATGQLSIGRIMVLSIIATQGDINDVLNMCGLIDHLILQGYYDFYVVHPVTEELIHQTVYYLANCAGWGLKGGKNGNNRMIQPDEFAVSHFPNPFLDIVTIKYTIPDKSTVSLAIYDIAGKQIEQSITNDTKEAGIYEYEYEASRLDPGVYFYKLEINGKTTVSRIVKMK